MPWTIHARDGKLAITLGWQTDWSEPYQVRDWLVSNVPISRYPGLAGQPIPLWRPLLQATASPLRLNTDDADTWHKEQDRKRVRKPPKGDDYDYEWHDGKWHKVWH